MLAAIEEPESSEDDLGTGLVDGGLNRKVLNRLRGYSNKGVFEHCERDDCGCHKFPYPHSADYRAHLGDERRACPGFFKCRACLGKYNFFDEEEDGGDLGAK